MKLEPVIETLTQCLSAFKDEMKLMDGDWIWSDYREIERDLGMTIHEFEIMEEFRGTLQRLVGLGVEDHFNFSAEETLALKIMEKVINSRKV